MDKHKDNLDNLSMWRYMKLFSVLWKNVEDWYLFTLSNILYLSPLWTLLGDDVVAASMDPLTLFHASSFKGVDSIWKLIWSQIEALLFSPASGSHLQWQGVWCTLWLVFRWDGAPNLGVVEDYLSGLCRHRGHAVGALLCFILMIWGSQTSMVRRGSSC